TFTAGHALLRQDPVQAESRDHLKTLLDRAAGGVIFTTIQKFTEEIFESSPPAPLPGVQGSRKRSVNYRGSFEFAGLVKRARELRQGQTPAEDVLWELLRNRKLADAKFRRQHQFGEYICDFFCADA